MKKNVLVCMNAKGGCGKTTLAIHLAETLALHGFSTVVVDSDPQGTSTLWSMAGDGMALKVVSAGPLTMTADLARLSAEYAYVVVDCVPSSTAPGNLAALDAAAVVLIPCQTSTPDLWATTAVLELLARRHPTLPCLVVPNAMSATTVSKEVLELMEGTWPVSRARLGARACYREAAARGTTVHSMSGRGPALASREVKDLAFEIIATMNRSAA